MKFDEIILKIVKIFDDNNIFIYVILDIQDSTSQFYMYKTNFYIIICNEYR